MARDPVSEGQEVDRKLLGRRGLLVGALGAAAAAFAGKVKDAAAVVQYVVLGQGNTSTTTTSVSTTTTDPALAGLSGAISVNLTETAGLVGLSDRLGVFGAAPDVVQLTATTMPVAPPGRIGVLGVSPLANVAQVTAPVGVFGLSGGIGVIGHSVPGSDPALTLTAGVFGASNDIGVLGASPPVTMAPTTSPVGVGGIASGPSGVGVRAEHTAGGVGLDVLGKARFMTAGTGTVAKKALSHQVSEGAVGESSVVLVTLHSGPATVVLTWVERQPGTGFVLHFSGKKHSALAFSYLVVEPGS